MDGATNIVTREQIAAAGHRRRLKQNIDEFEVEFFQHCRDRPDGKGIYERDSKRIERMAAILHRAAGEIARLHGQLEVASEYARADQRVVTLELPYADLIQRFADSVELGEEASQLLGAHLKALGA